MTTTTRPARTAKSPSKRPAKAVAKSGSRASPRGTATAARDVPAPSSARRPAARGGLRGALAGSGHVTPAGSNVFADLGFAPEEAENLKVRARLMDEIRRVITARRLTQAQAGVLFGVAQPRVSDLTRGKIGLFTIDALVNMLARAGVGVSVYVTAAAA